VPQKDQSEIIVAEVVNLTKKRYEYRNFTVNMLKI